MLFKFSKAMFLVMAASIALPVIADELSANESEALKKERIAGPADIALADQGVLKLPAGFVFMPSKEAKLQLSAMGSSSVENVIGVIIPEAKDQYWYAILRFIDSGYIKDDDAKVWDADELFESIRVGTEEGNENRKKMGLSEMEVVRWVEKPQYNSAMHQLKWSILGRDKGNVDESQASVNYNTYVLGREGYLSLNFVTGVLEIEKEKPIAQMLLDALSFKDGKAYGDFNESTDKIAAYGLAALVAGAAAKKLGLLAVILAFVAKFAKVLIVGGIAVMAAIGKFFSRRRAKSEEL